MTTSTLLSFLRPARLAIATGIVLLASSCGSGSSSNAASTETTTSPTAPASSTTTTAPADDSRPDLISEQDIAEARAAFESGQADWEASGISSYTLDVGLTTVGSVRVEVVEGVVVSEVIEGAEVDEWFHTPLPRTVEELFSELDAIIAVIENDPALVPPLGDCGSHHLNARFDAELGYPSYYDTLGPCDDGVGISATVTPLAEG